MALPRLQVTRDQALAKAKAEVGVRESPMGSDKVKYTEWYGVRTAWCAIFVLWLLRGRHLRSAWCPSVASWYRRNGAWHEPADLQPGDQIFFDWGEPGSSGFNHTGLVVKRYGPRDYLCVEGNWSNGVRYVRRKSGTIVGGGRPNYAPAAAGGRRVSVAAVIRAAKADPDREQGGQTAGAADDVRIVEDALSREGLLPARFAGDGSFGSKTVAAYRAWQVRCGFGGDDADGIPGRTTLRKLGDKYGFDVVD